MDDIDGHIILYPLSESKFRTLSSKPPPIFLDEKFISPQSRYDKANPKELTREDLISRKVNIWFNDKKRYYQAKVLRHLSENSYLIKKSNGHEEVVELELKDNTIDKSNLDRWNFIEE